MGFKVATAAAALLFLLPAVAPSAAAAASAQAPGARDKKSGSLRALQPGRNDKRGERGEGGGDISFLPEPSVECNVYLALGSKSGSGKRRLADDEIVEEEEDENEILQCILDDEGTGASRIFEIQGLDEGERKRVKDQVTADGGGGEHRFSFPGATKNKGGSSLVGGGANSKGPNVLTVPARGPGRKYQAVDVVDKRSDRAYESNTRRTKRRRDRRNLAIRKEGVSNVLLLRVEAADASTSCSHQDCAALTFGGYDSTGYRRERTLVTQIEDCSYGKLRFVPTADNPLYPALINATATITLTQNVFEVHHGTVLDWTTAAAPALVGPLDQYDHIMVYMPPGVSFGGAAAWGHVGWKYSWYMDSYSLVTGVHLHELGHNLGLGHSPGDTSCFMGSGYGDVRKCYNAPKSHWLGWYQERHIDIDPLTMPSKLVELVGLADYNETMTYGSAETQAVVLKIDMYEERSLYLMYNRQEKMNAGVPSSQDKVTITNSDGSSTSYLWASLKPGQKYHTPLVAGSGMMLEIIACDRAEGNPDTFTVSVHVMGVGEPLCIPGSPIPSWGSAYGGALSDMMVGYYNFDDDLLDSSGKGHHGLIGGGTSSFTEGKVGKALSLDGVDDFISLPNVNDFNFGLSDFTLTFWYRVSGDQSGEPAIITNKDWMSGLNVGWLVSSNYGPGSNGDDLSINFSDGISKADASQALDVDFNAWHFVAVRIKRGGMMSLLRSSGGDYGLQEDSINLVTGSVDSGLPIRIGASHGYEAKTKMDIDDLGIWRRALSSEEVDAIFMAGLSRGTPLTQAMDPVPPPVNPMPTTLVANYELENDLRDTSCIGGQCLDATLEDGGGASYGMSDFGAYLNLDNVNAPSSTFLTLPDSSLLDFGNTSDFTISFWHRTSVDFATLPNSDPSIITNKNFYSGTNPGYTIGIGSNGKLEYNSGDGSSRCDYDGPAGVMNDGQWHHVAMTQTQTSGQLALYLDGRKVVQKACALNSHSSGYAIRVGASWSYPSLYSGDIDKIMIHRSALSHANVFSLYGSGQGLTMTGSPTSSLPPTRSPTMHPTDEPSSPPTLTPTESPLSCDGVYDDVWCCGSESVKQADYRGTISVTQAGVECQAWSSQSPHSHTRTPGYYPNSGLDENYCRNPDGEPRAWCYTSSATTRWDYCSIPTCGTLEPTPNPTPSPSSSPTTAEPTASPTDEPTPDPTKLPTLAPTPNPTTAEPTNAPTDEPTNNPTDAPSDNPTPAPTKVPTKAPTDEPTNNPTDAPSDNPTPAPTKTPTDEPTNNPTDAPSDNPTPAPTKAPTDEPTNNPTDAPSDNPTESPTTPEPTPNPTPAPTTSPTPEPECTGIDNSCCGSFWFGVKQADYRGTISKTVGGIECQAWSSQSPHGHGLTPENNPDAGLDENYCRNPDGEPRAWCYTSSAATRWDYCDVKSCPACEAGNPDQCGCMEVLQADFRGSHSQTISGYECQAWSSQSPHSHTRTPESYPNAGLETNACRNPDGEPGGAWCYTSNPNKRWEYCAVPVCGQ